MEIGALVGAWKLQTGEIIDMFGPEPQGWVLITDSGRVAALLTTSGRADSDRPETLFRTMMAYTGAVRVAEPGVVTFLVDQAWQPGWVGTEQIRHYMLEGDRLKIRSGKQTHPRHGDQLLYGILEWTRA
jgi:hypothetical protein